MRSTRLRAAALVVALALPLGACKGPIEDEGGSEETSSPSPTEETANG